MFNTGTSQDPVLIVDRLIINLVNEGHLGTFHLALVFVSILNDYFEVRIQGATLSFSADNSIRISKHKPIAL